jgi:hypothetical protein
MKASTPNLDKLLVPIAKKHLGIETLETRHTDGLDFHDVPVWGVRAALLAAFRAGFNVAEATNKPAESEISNT